ncbi:MAG: AAA family ATPase, partial [Actinobacteria bacterium]|nr:AAA family ATPase [Actinomycetota bacterium]
MSALTDDDVVEILEPAELVAKASRDLDRLLRPRRVAAVAPLATIEHRNVQRWNDRCFTIDQLADLPEPTWLVEGLLAADSLAVMYGPSGQRKSFVAIDVACHIATGRPWHGKTTAPGKVVYVAAEGVAGLGKRFTAWQLHHRP